MDSEIMTENEGGGFNTLALNRTTQAINIEGDLKTYIKGKGSEIADKSGMRKKAKRKKITSTIIMGLIKIAEAKGAKDRLKQYWNTWYCQNKLIRANGKVFGDYCKNRICLDCTAIKKANLLNKYMPIIKNWEHPCMTTLTVQSVKKEMLNVRIEKMIIIFQTIINKYNKRNERGKGIKLIGLRTLECNFNAEDNTYNPHFHILVPNPKIGTTLMREWRLYWDNEKLVRKGGQDTRPIKNREKGMIEIVKYFTKIFSFPDPRKKKRHQDRFIYIAAIDNIIEAFEGHHTFDKFGFFLSPEKKNEKNIMELQTYSILQYDPKRSDWISKISDETLANYQLPKELEYLLENNINLVAE